MSQPCVLRWWWIIPEVLRISESPFADSIRLEAISLHLVGDSPLVLMMTLKAHGLFINRAVHTKTHRVLANEVDPLQYRRDLVQRMRVAIRIKVAIPQMTNDMTWITTCCKCLNWDHCWKRNCGKFASLQMEARPRFTRSCQPTR